mmetsp:Transcript_30748/g.70361  ORF Transcript_30748/g.70361 Transcript_30748/m.70361 type:complete len:82 (-) Transcript_30748:126-371(-)
MMGFPSQPPMQVHFVLSSSHPPPLSFEAEMGLQKENLTEHEYFRLATPDGFPSSHLFTLRKRTERIFSKYFYTHFRIILLL